MPADGTLAVHDFPPQTSARPAQWQLPVNLHVYTSPRNRGPMERLYDVPIEVAAVGLRVEIEPAVRPI